MKISRDRGVFLKTTLPSSFSYQGQHGQRRASIGGTVTGNAFSRSDRTIDREEIRLFPRVRRPSRWGLRVHLFGTAGPTRIVVDRGLAEFDSIVAERRISTTLAHEAGHCLFHAHLFAATQSSTGLFTEDGEGPLHSRSFVETNLRPHTTASGGNTKLRCNRPSPAALRTRNSGRAAVSWMSRSSGIAGACRSGAPTC